ncbi:MAG: DUF2249 domain-containing protein [Bacillota bacterium]
MNKQEFAVKVDVREYEPKDKQSIIFETFDSLEKGCQMELINDHDPKPLNYQFAIKKPGIYTCRYLEKGPVIWRVVIGRV